MSDNKPKLDPNSTYAPDWCDPSKVIEEAIEEAKQLEAIKAKSLSASLEIGTSAQSELSVSHRLISLLLACGASTLDIALELKITAEEIHKLEMNRLIEDQVSIYKDRFFANDPQSQLKQMLPEGIKYLQQVLGDSSIVDADKKLDMVKWLVEKVTGKATQQIEHGHSITFAHILDEMKNMNKIRDQIQSGAQHSPGGSHKLIDVTPVKQANDQYTDWVKNWQAGNT